MNYIITGQNFTSPILDKYEDRADYILMTEKELKNSNIEFLDTDKIYAPDETSVPIILEKIKNEERRERFDDIKNKYKCRKLLKSVYPDFYFEDVKLNNLEKIELPVNKKFIIKPQKGFFGAAVKEIDSTSDLKKIRLGLEADIKKHSQFFSADVFTADDFIIEEFVEGDEYTFDVFYDENAKPVIVNFCGHPESRMKEYFHLLYYTSGDIYERFSDQVIEIFTKFNKSLGIKNLPIHAEFREVNGKLIPIEWNIPRFGGFGVADLPYHGFGLDPFECFFENIRPDWNEIWTKHKGKYYGWVLCYNGLDLDLEKNKPDYEKLEKDLGNILYFHKLDYKTNPAFAIAYIERDNKKDLFEVLNLDFRDYFIPVGW